MAATLQDDRIIKLLIKKGVNINRKDSSNNTPLHYSIMGKNIECPQSISVKSLNPQKPDQIIYNTILTNVEKEIQQLLTTNNKFSDSLIHIINTIVKIPQMVQYIDNYIKSDVTEMFIESTLSSKYSGDGVNNLDINNDYQTKIEQIVDKYYGVITNDILKGLNDKIQFAPNSGGWGPTIGLVPPTDVEKSCKNQKIC